MKAQRDKATNKWKIQYSYTDWQGYRKKSTKRGFDTKKEAEEIFLEVKEKWKDYLKEWLEKLEQFYNTQLNNIQEVDSKEKVEEYKQKLVEVYEDFKKKIKSL